MDRQSLNKIKYIILFAFAITVLINPFSFPVPSVLAAVATDNRSTGSSDSDDSNVPEETYDEDGADVADAGE